MREGKIHVPASAAFLSSPSLAFLNAKHRALLLSPRGSKIFTVHRRIRLASSEKLYPDPDPIEPIENPVQPGNNVNNPQEGPEVLFEKLNARREKRNPDSHVVKSSLEAANDVEQPLFKRDEDDNKASSGRSTPEDEMDYKKAARALWRIGWVTWWMQLILTVVSGVILVFSFAFPGVNIKSSASALGFIVTGIGVFLAFVSLFWTYSYTRLSLWLSGDRTGEKRTKKAAQNRISRKLKIGLMIAVVGMIVSLTGLQAIVGTLLARLLSSGVATTPYTSYQMAQGAASATPGSGIVQPVDILVVQASANAMMGLLAALATTIWLRGRSKKWQKSAERT